MSFFKKEKKPEMEQSSIEVIGREIKSFKKWNYFLFFEFAVGIIFGLIFYIISMKATSIFMLCLVVINIVTLGMIANRVQYLRFLVYIKKGEP